MFWGDCVLTAAHTINKMPLVPLNNITPYKRLYGTKPLYDLLKVFGCLCFVSTLKRDRTMLTARAGPCMFIGYSQQQKGYKLYNLKTKCTLMSRDVCFHEKCFPYSFSDMDQTPMKHIFVPRSNYPMNESECENTQLCTPEDSNDNTHLCILADPEQPHNMTMPNPILPSTNNNEKVPKVSNDHISDKVQRPLRHKSKHVYLQDYNYESKETAHWCNLIQFNALSSTHKHIVKNLDEYTEPRLYLEAFKHSKWVEAMDKELKALSQNHT